MNKIMRFALVLAVLAVVAFAAVSGTVWAGKSVAPAASAPEAGAEASNGISTVRPEGCGAVVPVDSTVSSLCGIATIVSGNGQEIGTSTLGNRPDGFANKKVNVNLTKPGDAKLCFGAKNGGVIYFYNVATETWIPLLTTVENGIACAQISFSGSYVLGK